MQLHDMEIQNWSSCGLRHTRVVFVCVVHPYTVKCHYDAVQYNKVLYDWPWISPWIKSISNKLDITIHVIASQWSGHCCFTTREINTKITPVSAETVCHSSTYIILYIFHTRWSHSGQWGYSQNPGIVVALVLILIYWTLKSKPDKTFTLFQWSCTLPLHTWTLPVSSLTKLSFYFSGVVHHPCMHQRGQFHP